VTEGESATYVVSSRKEEESMAEDIKVRMNWLKGMYIYTIVGAGGFGLAMLAVPELIKSMLGWPVQSR